MKVFEADGTHRLTIPGPDPQQRSYVEGVPVDADGDILAVDNGHNLIRRYGPDVTLLSSWPSSGVEVDDRLTPTGIAIGPSPDHKTATRLPPYA